VVITALTSVGLEGCLRDDQGTWHRLEDYIDSHSEAHFTHGPCGECVTWLSPDLIDGESTEEPSETVADETRAGTSAVLLTCGAFLAVGVDTEPPQCRFRTFESLDFGHTVGCHHLAESFLVKGRLSPDIGCATASPLWTRQLLLCDKCPILEAIRNVNNAP